MVITLFAVIVLAIIGLCGWCVWRFLKKKRPKGVSELGLPYPKVECQIVTFP